MNAITTVYKNKNASTVWNINVAIKNSVVVEDRRKCLLYL